MKKHVVICFLICIVNLAGFERAEAQGTKYKKKVVSFVDDVAASGSITLNSEQTDYIRTSILRAIKFERFNYAPLPPNIVANFRAELGGISSLTPESIKPVIDKTLSPQLLGILDINKELLSQQNLTEAERNTFLATKAKAAGLSAEQLESILNSGFFCIPYVESFSKKVEKGYREVKNEKGKVIRNIPLTNHIHFLRLAVIYYKLNVDRNNNPAVSFAGIAKGWDRDPIERSEIHEDETFEGKKIPDTGEEDFRAFKEAVDVSSLNIQLETKKIEAFKLTGEVTETTTFGVRINLGSKEGVGLDDTYWIEEFEETASGDIVKTKRGFVKIREVANNKTDEIASSYAQTITGTNYSSGLSVTELPLLGINGIIALGTFPVRLSTFDNKSLSQGFLKSTEPYNFYATVTSESKMAFGAMASIQADLANSAKISELWVSLNGGIGLSTVKGKLYIPKSFSNGTPTDTSISDLSAALSYYGGIGILKKFYFRRFGLIAQADVKYMMTKFWDYGKDVKNDGEVTYKLTKEQLGLDLKLALEIYLTPTISFGGGAEYNMFAASDSWTALVEDKDGKELAKNNDAKGPTIDRSGLGFSLWVNYSLPSLK